MTKFKALLFKFLPNVVHYHFCTQVSNKLATAGLVKRYCLLLLFLCPLVVSAQNGVEVSGLAVNAGTVTFNVSWDKDNPDMPALWSDSVWVFVDYNNAGKMTRLPVTAATASAGTVIKVDGNDKGAWVIGNARTNGSFSATVQLLTSAVGVAGACAYASNYPPVGKYVSDAEISFTGTLPYDIVLRNESGGTLTVQSGNTLLLPCDYTLASFTDATTGAQGIIDCIPMSGIDFTNPAVSKSQQASFVVSREPAVPNPAAITYRWSAPDFSPVTHEGRTYTSTAPATPGTYPVTLTAQSEGYCPLAITKVVEVVECTAPGSTVNFTAFVPCSNAATGATWTLLDTRESNNNQNYTVKKMADGRIWMVQDLKFGDKCNRTDFTGSSGKDLTNRVSSLSSSTYYGDCGTSTLANVGYYYDWAAAINKANAYKGNSTDVGCRGTGTAAFACQGLCPSGWHVSTEDEISALCSSFGAITGGCLNIPEFGANITGQFRPSLVDATSYYWHTSTMCDASNTKSYDGGGWGPFYCWGKDTGKPVRCLRNY